MSPPIRPIVQALLVADHVYADAATGKKIVAGIFHTIYARRNPLPPPSPASVSPSTAPSDALVTPPPGDGAAAKKIVRPLPQGGFMMGSPFAYISLVNVRGSQPFALRYVDLATDQVRFQIDLEVHSPDPIAPVEVVLPLPPLPTDGFGSFALELVWQNEPLGAYRIQIRQHPDDAPAPPAPGTHES